jgi:hypothetical protein
MFGFEEEIPLCRISLCLDFFDNFFWGGGEKLGNLLKVQLKQISSFRILSVNKNKFRVFFFVGGWEFLLSTAWRQGRLQNGDAPVFGSIEALVLFSYVWYVCVIV